MCTRGFRFFKMMNDGEMEGESEVKDCLCLNYSRSRGKAQEQISRSLRAYIPPHLDK